MTSRIRPLKHLIEFFLGSFFCTRSHTMIEVTSSFQAFQILKTFENPFAEEIWVLVLNAQLKVVHTEMIFRGTVDHCLIHPRDIFRTLIRHNASSFVLAHNHPSQEVLPSEQDLLITRKIHQLGLIAQIPLNDHVIFTKEKYFSMADNGFFKKWTKKAVRNPALY